MDDFSAHLQPKQTAGSIQVCSPQIRNKKKEDGRSLEEKTVGSGELVQMNTKQMAIQSAGIHRLHVARNTCSLHFPSSILGQLRSRLTLLQRQQALEFRPSLRPLNQQGHSTILFELQTAQAGFSTLGSLQRKNIPPKKALLEK